MADRRGIVTALAQVGQPRGVEAIETAELAKPFEGQRRRGAVLELVEKLLEAGELGGGPLDRRCGG